MLEFLHYSEPGAIKPFRTRTMDEPGLTHLSVSVDDIRATAQKAVEYGGEIIEDSDVGAAIFIRDPDGQLLELLPTGYRDRTSRPGPDPMGATHARIDTVTAAPAGVQAAAHRRCCAGSHSIRP